MALAAVALLATVAGCTSSTSNGSGEASSGAGVSASAAPQPAFICPSVNDINALAAVTLVASSANNSRNCQYTTTSAGVADTLVVLQHPPVGSEGQSSPTLAALRAELEAGGQVEISAEPHYSSSAFIARSGTQSCTVFVLARDGQVMSVQEFHTTASTTASCAIAESVVALAGTAASMAPVSPGVTPTASLSSVRPPASSASRSTSTPTPTPTSRTEVPVFSTGPAASYQPPVVSR